MTNYCTKSGSTSSTGNPSTTTESRYMSCSGHTSCSSSTNGTCIECSKPSNSSWSSTSGCGWSCNSGYFKHNNNCYITLDDNHIYAFKTSTGGGTKYQEYTVHKYDALKANTYTQTEEIKSYCSADSNTQYTIDLFFNFNKYCNCGNNCSCEYSGMYVKYKGEYISISKVYTYKFDNTVLRVGSERNTCYFNHSITRIK